MSRRLSTLDKIVILAGIASIILFLLAPQVANLLFTKTETITLNDRSPLNQEGLAVIQLESGDKIEVLINVEKGRVAYAMKAYIVKPNLGSEFNPAITRYRIIEGTKIFEEGTYKRVVTAKINANYAAEFRLVNSSEAAVEITFKPLEMPNWVLRLRVVTGIVGLIAVLYMFGRFYEEPKEALID